MTSISKYLYVDKLDDIVNKYNNTYHSTIKMKPVVVTSSRYIDSGRENNEEHPKLEVGEHTRISKYKNIFAKGYSPNRSEVFVVKKVKNTVPWRHCISDLNGEEIVEMFYKKELQRTHQKEFRVEKVIKRKGYKLYNEQKSYDNYATKSDLQKATGVATSNFAKRTVLASLKSDLDILDIDKLKTAHVNLSTLSNVVKSNVVKKDVYDELVKKGNAFRLMILVIELKRLTKIQKLMNLKKIYLYMINILLLLNLIKLTAGNFGERFKQAKLATKDDIADFVKKTNFDDKLKKLIDKFLQTKQEIQRLNRN